MKSKQLKMLGAISTASEMLAWCTAQGIDVGDAYAIEEFVLERSAFADDKKFAAAVQREATVLLSRLAGDRNDRAHE
jgi:hypothetical protein